MTTADDSGNVTLLVSNQSFAVDPVEIEISIDGEIVVRDTFDVAGDRPPQHNWQRYCLQLEPGTHRLVATANDSAELTTTFEVAGNHSLAIAHWTDPTPSTGTQARGYFTLESEQRPIATM